MVNRDEKRRRDLDTKPDTTQYLVEFYLKNEDGLQLYETLNMDSSPELPNEGDYIEFEFITDNEENEVFRQDGLIDEMNIGSDEEYSLKTSPKIQVDEINTKYRKHVTEQNKNMTTVTKIVILESVI